MPLLGSVLPRLNLRCLLLLAAAVGLVPLAALDIARFNHAKDAALVRAEHDMSELARQTVARHAEIIESTRRLLNVLSNIPAVRTASTACSDILVDLKAAHEQATDLTVVDAAGRGLCGTGDPLAFDASAQAYFSDMKRSKAVTISSVMADGTRHFVVVAQPLLDGAGTVEGAIMIGVDLGWIQRLAAQTAAMHGVSVYVVDRDGTALSAGSVRPRTGAEAGFLQELAKAPAGVWLTSRPSGEATVFGVDHLPDIGVTIGVGISRARVFAPVERAFWVDLLLRLAVALGSFGVTVLLVELGVNRGLKHIHQSARAMAAGNLHERARVPPSVREVEALAASFNTMVTQLEGLAYHDRLTGIGNRRLLERYLANATRTRTSGPFAVLAIDLDEFKPVNDVFGHRAGDNVLMQVAERLTANAGEADLVVRLGGDEFIVVLHENCHAATRIAHRLRDAVASPYMVENAVVNVGCCIGVAFVDHGSAIPGPVEMLDRADEALYEAKRTGRCRVVVTTSESGHMLWPARSAMLSSRAS